MMNGFGFVLKSIVSVRKKTDTRTFLLPGLARKVMQNAQIAPVLMLVLVSACTSTGVHDASTNEAATNGARVEDRLRVDEDVISPHSRSNPSVESIAQESQLSPVVAKLVQKAEQQKQLSNLDAAANNIERALRIEPRNAVLWSKLADIKFAQNNWQQALNLAKKSNTLNRDDLTLGRQNIHLIVQSLEAMGERDAAEKYRQQLN